MRRAGILFGLLLLAIVAAFEFASPAPLPRHRGPEPAPSDLIAERRYEHLLHGRRSAILEVRWTRVARDGTVLVRDVTKTRSRTARMMGRVRDLFESEDVTDILRTVDGDLVAQRTSMQQGGREDAVVIERTATGYHVRRSIGGREESFAIETTGPAKLDAEAFLGERIRAGEARPGTRWECRLLDVERRRLVDASFEVIGIDAEGPGLKVAETVEGRRALWWFDADGAVMRLRSGGTVVQRNDHATLQDAPGRTASFRVTLDADHDLPRLFDTREMLVTLLVERDETVDLPAIEPSPFTAIVGKGEAALRLRLLTHDARGVSATLPVTDPQFAPFLESTPLLESDSPELRAVAREVVGGGTDAREAAARIGSFVFRTIEKGSPDIAELSAREILRRKMGDCSEHATLFLALCRAAGIPARRCSGFVCAGDLWGGHAWAEIWVGAWIGVDPTTNEIGTRARYILCAREGDRERPPAAILPEFTRIRIERAVYDDGAVDFSEGGEQDEEVVSGIRLAADGWTVARAWGTVELDRDGTSVSARLYPDHGYREIDMMLTNWDGARPVEFGGRPAVRWGTRKGGATWLVPLGRHNLQVRIGQRGSSGPGDEEIAALFAPTLTKEAD
ncbi:MAG: transglutaminase-like domain-containing protein [Planctomycetaceae bacterium]